MITRQYSLLLSSFISLDAIFRVYNKGAIRFCVVYCWQKTIKLLSGKERADPCRRPANGCRLLTSRVTKLTPDTWCTNVIFSCTDCTENFISVMHPLGSSPKASNYFFVLRHATITFTLYELRDVSSVINAI